jgi:hypothetical protein
VTGRAKWRTATVGERSGEGGKAATGARIQWRWRMEAVGWAGMVANVTASGAMEQPRQLDAAVELAVQAGCTNGVFAGAGCGGVAGCNGRAEEMTFLFFEIKGNRDECPVAWTGPQAQQASMRANGDGRTR